MRWRESKRISLLEDYCNAFRTCDSWRTLSDRGVLAFVSLIDYSSSLNPSQFTRSDRMFRLRTDVIRVSYRCCDLLLFGFVFVCIFISAAHAQNLSSGLVAPFRSMTELDQFSKTLFADLATHDFDEVFKRIKKSAHQDDEKVMENLVAFSASFPQQRSTLRTPIRTRYIQQSKFGGSFLRHQYEIGDADSRLRCMVTYRRKTDGWRINQLLCELL